jgi:hypothetical protein
MDRLLELYVLFGDGTNFSLHAGGASCCKSWKSGTRLTVGHNWQKPGNFSIKAKVKDIYWDWSDWGTFDVHVQKSNLNLKNSIRLDLDIIKISHILKIFLTIF